MKNMSKKVLLGISGSLRNARRGLGGNDLISDLKKISKKEELNNYLFQEAKIHLENFEKVNEIMSELFEKPYPARAAFEVSKLPKNSSIEVETIAYKGSAK